MSTGRLLIKKKTYIFFWYEVIGTLVRTGSLRWYELVVVAFWYEVVGYEVDMVQSV